MGKLRAKSQLSLQFDPFDKIGMRPTEAERSHALRVMAILAGWHAPDVLFGSVLAAPFLERDPHSLKELKKLVSKESIDFATQLVEWRKLLASGSSFTNGTSGEWLSVALARLYRLAYLEIPKLSVILLLLADHDARFTESESPSQETALTTLEVFAPLAEMLGIWSLCRKWMEKSYAALYPDQHAEMNGLLGLPEDDSERTLKRVERLASNNESLDSQLSSTYIQDIEDKAEAYAFLKTTLRKRLDKRQVKVQIKQIPRSPGLSLRRARKGDPSEDVALRLRVRVICCSVADCYTTLGVIHSLGKPLSIGSTLHFKDHIASPQANGYRALHATITLQNFRKNGGGEIVVECRIMTKRMHHLNEEGVIVAQLSVGKVSPLNAWWDRIPALDRQLAKTKAGGNFAGIQDYMNRHQIQSVSDPLYVFTPRGEIVLLPAESTPLDFAYSIHTQMGHHALRTDVNGKPVPHGYPLRNGDIVHIHYDPNLAGPDISWLGHVKTSSARRSIRRGLRWRASGEHQGRAVFEEALLETLSWFERKKGYKLAVSTERIQDFILDRARVSGYSEVRQLYAELIGNSRFTEQLVQQLVSAEFASSIVNARDRPVISIYDLHNIKLCMTCRATPGEPIIGIERISHSGKRHLTVHLDGKDQCGNPIEDSKRIALGWAKPALNDANELLVFRIKGVDRPGLLREVLSVVYQTRETDLLKVDARTDAQGLADIVLLVRGEWFGGLDRMPESWSLISGVREIKDSAPSPSQRMALSVVPISITQYLTPNPYTPEEVFHRGIFYDRQDLLDAVASWLTERAPHDPMILHGQRRVGKTSLVKYLMYEYLAHRAVHPIFVDLQGLDEYNPHALASLIVRRVHESLKITPPNQEADEPVWLWVDRALRHAVSQHPRLLIIIDEFNFLIDEERAGKLKAGIFNNLRFLINARREIKWMLVVQDTHFMDRDRWLGAGVLFQSNRTLHVPHLDRDWASRLILEPAKKCGVTLRNEARLLNRIYRLTAGNPFLIHLICHELVNRAKKKDGVVDDGVLIAALAVVLHVGERHFDHFTKGLTDVREVVMAAVASLLKHRKTAPVTEVLRLLKEAVPELRPEVIEKNLNSLAAEGQLAFKHWRIDGPRRVMIPIELYRQFITGDLNLEVSIEKWRATRKKTSVPVRSRGN